MDQIFGLIAIIIGLLLLAPFTPAYFKRYRDRQVKAMPWLLRIPGVRAFYSDPVQAVVIRVVAFGFLAIGLVMLLGIVDSK